MVSKIKNSNAIITDNLLVILVKQVEENRDDLISQYQQSLQNSLFTNRSEVRPSMLGRIAEEEVDSLLYYLSSSPAPDIERGAQLCQIGLSEQSVLRLGQATRQFLLTHLNNEQIAPALTIVDNYQDMLIRGFIKNREITILTEQERIRSALQIAISRYTIEIGEIEALARQATEASEFKSRFLGRVSHELRTPLGALLGMSEMLQNDVYGPLSPAQEDITMRIVSNVHTLERIFTELLDQSQIETGQLHLREEAFSPRLLAQTVHLNYLPIALQKGINLQLYVDPNLPITMTGDNRRIEQILSNLVVNAVKYTDIGSIMIYVRKDMDTRWSLQVRDTGIGIPEEALAYIFEPFRKVDEPEGRTYDGVGLGLAIVQQLATTMGGTVSVESKLGQGSTFTVVLPIKSN